MAFKTAAPCDVFREHIGLNPGSFSTVANTDSDFFPETARIEGMPARLTHTHDTTAYATTPIEDSWGMRLHGSGSNANSNGSQRGGQLT